MATELQTVTTAELLVFLSASGYEATADKAGYVRFYDAAGNMWLEATPPEMADLAARLTVHSSDEWSEQYSRWVDHVDAVADDDSADDDAIDTLRDEAAAAGDMEQFDICTAALQGDADARRECARVIAEAAAQAADYVWSPANADSDGQDTSGSLEDAMAYAAAWDVTLTLRSANGESRGWAKPGGDYSLQ